jgi:hypothetical protein
MHKGMADRKGPDGVISRLLDQRPRNRHET